MTTPKLDAGEVVNLIDVEPVQALVDELATMLDDARAGAITGMVSVVRRRGGENVTVQVGLINRPMLVAYAARIQRQAMDDWIDSATDA